MKKKGEFLKILLVCFHLENINYQTNAKCRIRARLTDPQPDGLLSKWDERRYVQTNKKT